MNTAEYNTEDKVTLEINTYHKGMEVLMADGTDAFEAEQRLKEIVQDLPQHLHSFTAYLANKYNITMEEADKWIDAAEIDNSDLIEF